MVQLSKFTLDHNSLDKHFFDVYSLDEYTYIHIYFIYYASWFLGEHKATTNNTSPTDTVPGDPLQLGLCRAGCLHLCINTSVPSLFWQLTFRFLCGFQSRAYLVILEAGLRSVCLIHPHFRFLMSISIGACLILTHFICWMFFQRNLLKLYFFFYWLH